LCAPPKPQVSLSAAMDEETAKEIQRLQDELTSLLSRKRKRDDDALEDEVKHLKERLTNSIKRCQDANLRSTQLSKKNKELEIENELLEKSTKDQAHSINRLGLEIDELEQENNRLKAKLEKLEKHEATSKNAISALKKLGSALEAVSEIDVDTLPFHTSDINKNCYSSLISLRSREQTLKIYLHQAPPIMVTPADMIRELTLNNKLLVKKNEALKVENHNLKVTNDMLKNKAATDQAIMNAAVTIKNLEAYNQTLENENQHLREQLEHCAEKKKIDGKLEVLRKEVEAIDEELAKRMAEMDLMQELSEKMKLLKQIDAQEGQKENESDGDDVFQVHTKEADE
ncbi:hypothetical protein KCU99_g8905, partial [Aureobasidium melanogenum]